MPVSSSGDSQAEMVLRQCLAMLSAQHRASRTAMHTERLRRPQSIADAESGIAVTPQQDDQSMYAPREG